MKSHLDHYKPGGIIGHTERYGTIQRSLDPTWRAVIAICPNGRSQWFHEKDYDLPIQAAWDYLQQKAGAQ